MEIKEILQRLPYTKPFLFVDSLESIDEMGVVGSYTYSKDLDFYKGHFQGYPVTPGVILTETMAQIGLVCHGIFLSAPKPGDENPIHVMLTSTAIEFLKPVFPGERVTVTSEKTFFRFKKLVCSVEMRNESGEVVCKGTLSGMVTNKMLG